MNLKTPGPRKIMLIANPNAGDKTLKAKWNNEIYPFLRDKLKNFEVTFTKKQGDATRIASEACHNAYQLILAMGGDGTLNEVVNGFFKDGQLINPEAVLGILPYGSGGDFVRTLRFDHSYKKAAVHLTTRKTKQIDLGMIEYSNPKYKPRYFINIAETGLGGAIMKRVNAKNKKIPALARYITGSFQGFMDYKNCPVRIHLKPQGTHEVNLTNLIIANGQYFGRGMRPAPQAKLDDGLFDVVVIKNMSLSKFVINFPQIYMSKKFVSSNILDFFQASEIKVEAVDKSHKLLTEVDGENHGEGNIRIKILPGVLKIKV
ncbi:MAG: diacylglycerol kinase family lipid kinase [Deltaproteobacteria bacterium]|nr:diacylglycerol kinase family lipid kinase [Deltaproteobacteria bacterium]